MRDHLVVGVEEAIVQSRWVLEASRAACRRTEDLMSQSRALKGDRGCQVFPRWFAIAGQVGEFEVRARWACSQLWLSPRLQDRAEAIVRRGERFVVPGTDEVVSAGLDSSIGAMLTLLRACDRIVDLGFGPVRPTGMARPPRASRRLRGGPA